MDAESKLLSLGYELPPAPRAVGVYRPAMNVGNLCYTSGHVPLLPDGNLICGCVGNGATEEDGFAAARQVGLTILATLKNHLGSLNQVERVVKIFGLVNCADDFKGQPAVMNGCSELMKEVFGDDHGVGTRSAVGTNSLPLGVMVEIEAIFQIREL